MFRAVASLSPGVKKFSRKQTTRVKKLRGFHDVFHLPATMISTQLGFLNDCVLYVPYIIYVLRTYTICLYLMYILHCNIHYVIFYCGAVYRNYQFVYHPPLHAPLIIIHKLRSDLYSCTTFLWYNVFYLSSEIRRWNLYCATRVVWGPKIVPKLKTLVDIIYYYTHIIEQAHVFELEYYSARLIAYLSYTTNIIDIADGPTDGSRILLWRVRLLSATRARTLQLH